MRGIILTGQTGVGKTTAQVLLRDKHGFWVPRTCTTRQIEANEVDQVHFSDADFLKATRDGDIVLPAWFGGHWYGWFKEDLQTLKSSQGKAVLNLRPYPALLLQATLGFVAVWLTLDEHELARRRADRHADRDFDASISHRRHLQDQEDLAFLPCFSQVHVADHNLAERLLELLP